MNLRTLRRGIRTSATMTALGVALAGAFALVTAGCGKEREGPIGPKPLAGGTPVITGAPAATIAKADLDAIEPAAKPYRLALIVKTRNNPFFTPMIAAAQEEAKAVGVTLDVQAPAQESDYEQQFAMVESIAAKGVDAILIAPADSKAIVPALKAAARKGILVLNIDNRVDRTAAQAAGLALAGYVGADNEEGGKLAGEAMVAALKGSGKVAVLEGIRGADNAEARRRGFEAATQGKLDIVAKESAEWDTQKAYQKFQSMLAAHKEIAGVFCANDKMAIGAIKAIEEAGRTKTISVVGYDNIADVRRYLSAGEMDATIEQHPDLMGKYGVRMAVGILAGKLPKSREFLVPLDVIRKQP